ncbi:MAG: hypothetical protein QM504_14250 [Pseudomonadota bacterium]
MKKVKLLLFILALATSTITNADSCTRDINNYISGIKSYINSPGATDINKNSSKSMLINIETMRKTNKDCVVRSNISAFRNSDKAIEFARKSLEAHK